MGGKGRRARWATRVVSTRVLPEPGPAITRIGCAVGASTTALCSGFSVCDRDRGRRSRLRCWFFFPFRAVLRRLANSTRGTTVRCRKRRAFMEISSDSWPPALWAEPLLAGRAEQTAVDALPTNCRQGPRPRRSDCRANCSMLRRRGGVPETTQVLPLWLPSLWTLGRL